MSSYFSYLYMLYPSLFYNYWWINDILKKKQKNAIHGKGRTYNYVVYAVGQKEGYTYCILHEDKNVECRNESVNTNVYKIYTDEFIEIFNSIERIGS